MRGQPRREPRSVLVETLRATLEEIDNGLRRVLGAEEAFEHAVAGHGIDEAGSVADEERPAAGERRARLAERQPIAAQLLEVVE
jgi:hypothetical protein